MATSDTPLGGLAPRTLLHRFAFAALAAGLGNVAAAVLFPGSAGLVSVFLFVLAHQGTTGELLDRNRDQIWLEGVAPRRANSQLAWALIAIFLGVLAAYAAVSLLASREQVVRWFDPQLAGYQGASLAALRFGTFEALAAHNALVLLICFLFALLYVHGGMLLVLAWNASRWAVVLSLIARVDGAHDPGGPLAAFGRAFIAIFPHLVLEALAYVLGAMAGVFLARALRRHPLRSPAFGRVTGAVLRLALLATATLLVAALVEAHVAPALVSWIRPEP